VDRVLLRQSMLSDGDRLLQLLTTRQHLCPLGRLDDVLRKLSDELGICPTVVIRAMEWLDTDGNTAIGRLRRTELTQLARALHRFWRQTSSLRPLPVRA